MKTMVVSDVKLVKKETRDGVSVNGNEIEAVNMFVTYHPWGQQQHHLLHHHRVPS